MSANQLMSLVDAQSQSEASHYFDKLSASNPKGPAPWQLIDTPGFVTGRQFVPAFQGMGNWHMPAHLLKPENDLHRTQIDERMNGAQMVQVAPPSATAAQVWQLTGVGPESWQSS